MAPGLGAMRIPGAARPLRFAGLGAVLVATAACGLQPLNEDGREAVRAWLTCDECVDGERARVGSLGADAIATLRGSLFDPPSQQLENMRAQYSRLYAMLPSPGVDSATFVDRYLRTLNATVNRRAAISLADLEAWNVLEVAADSAATRGDTDLESFLRAQLLRWPSRSVPGTGIAESWQMVAPETDVEVCNGDGPAACTSTASIDLMARASGPSGTFANPWARVYFYANPASSSDPPDLLGEVDGYAAAITDDETQRHYLWTFRFGPHGWPLGRVRVFAVGVDSSSAAFRTPADSLVTVVGGR